MRIKIQQFLFKRSHSWAVIGQNIGRELLNRGYDVDFISTDGIEEDFIPNDLMGFVKDKPSGKYDLQLSYTAPHNWPHYLNKDFGGKRLAIWNYEYNVKNSNHVLLPGFGKFSKDIDYLLPSSNFSKEVFLNMKVPDNKMIVVPHGIFADKFGPGKSFNLKTKKTKKILLNIAQPHKRKAIHLALESFGKAFNKQDDVCLVAKILKQNATDQSFNIDFNTIYKSFEKKYPNHAEVEIVYDYIKDISEIYRSCDVNFSATFAECWHLPSLEALASGLINVVPNYGGIKDFCNDENSLLINGKIVRCPKDHLYWQPSDFAIHFEIDTNDAAKKLQESIFNSEKLREKFLPNMKNTVNKFSWKKVTDQILGI